MRQSVLIIAEAGVNHNGSISQAKKLIDAAVEAKVDLVKFQTFKADRIVSPTAVKANYQIENTYKEADNSQYKMLKKLELSENDHLELIDYAKKRGIPFFSTAFDTEGLDYLNNLGFEFFKIPSGEITNYPYLKKIASFKKPIILSTGMANLREIEVALEVLISNGLSHKDITILHCNTEYPTPMQDVNLKAMLTIRDAFKVSVGYSDHTLGIEVPIAAVAMGATVIEKHFTLDRNLSGPDHKASLEPHELKMMVKSIRNIEQAIKGLGIKAPSESERKNKDIIRKSIHINKELKKGHTLNESDLIALRPGSGISTMNWNQVIGQKIANDLPSFSKLKWGDLS